MKVKCLTTQGYLHTPHEVKEGLTRLTTYGEISKDTCYLVYGIIHYGGGFRYLLYDDLDMTYWYPAELFEVIDTSTPGEWHFEFNEQDTESVSAVWGYKDLLTPGHIDGLGNLENEHIRIFLRAKDKMYAN